ncbi:helix-turn-helix domain-containing protein [Streptomyces sp. NPDC018031]|uniref:helix-turn-helix domain-containing protein n=1 Tax=Streptomyces sp. NPDC018031 TaxID=3365033 RepID=UPI0037936402
MGSGEVERFAECLRELKERSGRSYGVLAKRLHMSTSTLHRYCSGEAVPTEYARVERLARLCGAGPEELVRLHRYWLLADAVRRTGPGRTGPPAGPATGGTRGTGTRGRGGTAGPGPDGTDPVGTSANALGPDATGPDDPGADRTSRDGTGPDATGPGREETDDGVADGGVADGERDRTLRTGRQRAGRHSRDGGTGGGNGGTGDRNGGTGGGNGGTGDRNGHTGGRDGGPPHPGTGTAPDHRAGDPTTAAGTAGAGAPGDTTAGAGRAGRPAGGDTPHGTAGGDTAHGTAGGPAGTRAEGSAPVALPGAEPPGAAAERPRPGDSPESADARESADAPESSDAPVRAAPRSGRAHRPGAGSDRPGPAGSRPGPLAAAVFAARGAARRGRLPWALMVGAAAALVLAVTAAEVRPHSGDGRADTAAEPGPPRPAGSGSPAPGPDDRASAGPRSGERGSTERPEPEAEPRAKGRRGGAPTPSGTGAGQQSGGASGGSPGSGRPAGTGTPLTLTTRSHVWENGCDHRYLIDRPAARVAPPPVEQDAAPWAAAHGAVHGGTTNVEVTVKGRSSSAVVLQDLHVRVVERRAPLPWSSFAMENGCGGALTPSAFAVNLDADRPLARPTDGFDGEHTVPAVRLPYRVSDSDPEVLLVNARTAGCDCDWYLELDWTSGDRSGTVRIDDNGRPFRTSGIEGRPAYGYALDQRTWLAETR